MNIIDRLLNAAGFKRREVAPAVLAATARLNGQSPRPNSANLSEFLSRYADQAWLYACIRVIQTKGAGIPLKVYRWDAAAKKAVEVADSPLQDLLDKANDLMNGYDLREATLGFYDLTGNAYWLLDKVVDEKPSAIWPLNPKNIQIVPHPTEYVKEYEYRINGEVVRRFKPEEIMHFKSWNPLDDYLGLAPVAAARDASDVLMYSTRYNRSFFENSAEPAGILSSDSNITADNKKVMAETWKKLHSGVRKWWSVAVLDGGLKFTPTATNHRDMQFPELTKMTRQDVLTVYSMPPILVGIDSEASYNNATVQERLFWKNCLIPRLQKIESVINEKLAPLFGSDLYVAHDLAGIESLQADEKVRAETDQILVGAGIKKINEVRTDRNLPPVPWGNTWNAPIGIMPIDESRDPLPGGEEPAMPNEPMDDEPMDDETMDDDMEEEKKPKKASQQTPHESPVDKSLLRRNAVWLQFKGLTESLERKWLPMLRSNFSAQEREVINNIRDRWEGQSRQVRLDGMKTIKQGVAVFLFDKSRWRSVFQKDGRKLIAFSLKSRADEEIRDNNLGIEFDLTNPLVSSWINDKAFRFANEINSTTEEALRVTLEEAIREGESIDAVSERVAKVFDIARGSRSKMIARTEVISASNKGAVEAYEQSGVVEGVEWISSRDALVRDEHRIDGEVVDMGSEFSNGLKFPGDPSGEPSNVINCRCATAPVLRRE